MVGRGLVGAAVDGGGVGLLDLGRRVGLGPEVGHRRRHDDDVGVLGGLGDGVLELQRGADRHDVDAGGAGSEVLAATSVTVAPRAAATCASAYPCLPEDRFPR